MFNGTSTGGAYCLLEVSLAPGISVPRQIHVVTNPGGSQLSGRSVVNTVHVLHPSKPPI